MSLNKLLMYKGGDPEKPRTILLAPTRVATVLINGAKIHCGIQINIRGITFPLNDREQAVLRNNLSKVKIIIIDESSIVSSMIHYQVNQRLNEIFGYSDQLTFEGMYFIVFGDF